MEQNSISNMVDGPDMAYDPNRISVMQIGINQGLSMGMNQMGSTENYSSARTALINENGQCSICKNIIGSADKFCAGCGAMIER